MKGDYACDAGIITISFKSESQRFLVSHLILKENISQDKNTSKGVLRLLPLGDAAVSPPELFSLSKDKSKGKGVERHSND